ncbi:hypothetical protein KCP71_10990 [Salmonella enterica subsp. enterica]|nr:hypothetical protein KCP71_10990 [Salmonella enterica subsp. enterica]
MAAKESVFGTYNAGITRTRSGAAVGRYGFADLPEVGATVSAGDDCARRGGSPQKRRPTFMRR